MPTPASVFQTDARRRTTMPSVIAAQRNVYD